jgi:hypothetical protein
VSKKVVIALESDVVERLRNQADEENITVSMLIARLLEREMHAPERYWRAFQDWKKRDRNLGIGMDVSKRFTRDEAHER